MVAVAGSDLAGKDYGLSDDQACAVEQVSTSGRVLDVLVESAETEKTSSMLLRGPDHRLAPSRRWWRPSQWRLRQDHTVAYGNPLLMEPLRLGRRLAPTDARRDTATHRSHHLGQTLSPVVPNQLAVSELRAGDTGAVQAVFDGLSPDSRVQRFLCAMPTLPLTKLRYLASPDGRHHVAFVATRGGAPVGIARYLRVDDWAAEVAVEVIDTRTGEGVASSLLLHLARNAVSQGLDAFVFTVAGDNHRVVGLLARWGAQMTWENGLVQATVSLVDVAPIRFPPTQLETEACSSG